MAYEKQTWAKGDVVTSAKLNHMEDGIATGGGVLVVNATTEDEDVKVLGSTWQEIYDAPVAFVKSVNDMGKNLFLIGAVYEYGGEYKVEAGANTYSAETANGYPASQGGK